MSRYRIEDGRAEIDLKIQRTAQLFDGRDPAPFRERDLDEDAVDYLVAAAEEIGSRVPLRVVVWIAEPAVDSTAAEPASEMIRGAMASHFGWALERLARDVRLHFRRAQLALLLGLGVLSLFLTLAQLTLRLPDGALRQVLREGLVIIGWVAMWRPIELLLYDWWPQLHQRRQLRRLQEAEVVVHEGRPG